MIRRVAFAALLATVLATSAHATYQVSGRFLYTDREFSLGGFTGAEPNLPIREADVQVVDANTQQVLATSVTDQTGSFNVQVFDNLTRDIAVRALTSSSNTPDLHLTVRHTSTSAIFAIAHPTISAHPPTADIDFTATPVVAPPGAGGDPFNIYDVVLDGLDFLATLRGSRPGAAHSLQVFWKMGSSNGTFYSHASRSIFLLGLSFDSDAYDDSVVLHELGHYVEFNFADSDNPGGAHSLNRCYDLRLAWSEGWSTFYQNMVRNWKGLARPEIYVDTSGQPGPGHAFISYGVETIGFVIDAGSGNEVSVNAVLWDIVDVNGTADGTPGTDDDGVQLADGAARIWDVVASYIPTVSNISVEDFWDGWFVRGNGLAPQLRAVFEVFSMQFYEDTFEPDNSAAEARSVLGGTTHHTLFGAGDQDWTTFPGFTGGTYFISTSGIPCGASVFLSLLDSDATTVLATSTSGINWTATKDGPLYLRVTRPGLHDYGSYDVTIDITVPVTITDVQLIASAEGLRLRWRARQEAGFSHFDVERSSMFEGPFVKRNAAPITATSTGPSLYEYLDPDVEPGARYYYRLVGVESSGEREVFGPYDATVAAPARVVLHPARPNPFNPNTVVSFDLPREGEVHLRIYDVTGRLVRTLVPGDRLPAGEFSTNWDGRDDDQRATASGVYLVQLDALGRRQIQRAVLVR